MAKGDAKAEEPPAEAAGDGDKAMRDLQGILNDAVTGSQFMDVHFFSHKPRGGYMTGPVIEVEVGHMMQHHTRVVQALKQGLVVQRAARRFDTADGPEVVELAQRLKVDVSGCGWGCVACGVWEWVGVDSGRACTCCRPSCSHLSWSHLACSHTAVTATPAERRRGL